MTLPCAQRPTSHQLANALHLLRALVRATVADLLGEYGPDVDTYVMTLRARTLLAGAVADRHLPPLDWPPLLVRKEGRRLFLCWGLWP